MQVVIPRDLSSLTSDSRTLESNSSSAEGFVKAPEIRSSSRCLCIFSLSFTCMVVRAFHGASMDGLITLTLKRFHGFSGHVLSRALIADFTWTTYTVPLPTFKCSDRLPYQNWHAPHPAA